MDLRHLRYFVTLAEELNFRQAASRLNIAQPPLSRQIRELEEEIGAKLFHRTKRRVELTNAGRDFLQKAYSILDNVEQAGLITRLASVGKSGEFRIGYNGSVKSLIPLLLEFRKKYPSVGLILNRMNSTEQINALHEKRIDLAFLTIPVGSDQIITRVFHPVSFVAAMPEDHPLTRKKKLFLRDLKDETVIIPAKSGGIRYYEAVMDIFRKAGFVPNITIQASDTQTVLLLVEAGMGITLEPSPGTENDKIIRRKLEDVSAAVTPSMAWHKDNTSELLRQFIEVVSHLKPKT